jgi:HEAT repeat protein
VAKPALQIIGKGRTLSNRPTVVVEMRLTGRSQHSSVAAIFFVALATAVLCSPTFSSAQAAAVFPQRPDTQSNVGPAIVVTETPEDFAREIGSTDITNMATAEGALTRLDTLLTTDTNLDLTVFSPVVEPLLLWIPWGGAVRRESARAKDILVKLGPVALPRLIEAVRPPDARGTTGPPQADAGLRRASAEIIGKMRPLPTNALETLIGLISDRDADLRGTCLSQLAAIGPQASNAVPLIRAGIGGPDAQFDLARHFALVRITGEAGTDVSAIAASLTNQDLLGHYSVQWMLGECGPVASNAAPQLLAELRNGPAQFKIGAADALLKIGVKTPEMVDGLIGVLNQQDDENFRRSAAGDLGALGSLAKPAVPLLIAALKNADATSRGRATGWWIAAEALGNIGGDEAVAGLQEALKSSDPDIRLTAERALGKLKAGTN